MLGRIGRRFAVDYSNAEIRRFREERVIPITVSPFPSSSLALKPKAPQRAHSKSSISASGDNELPTPTLAKDSSAEPFVHGKGDEDTEKSRGAPVTAPPSQVNALPTVPSVPSERTLPPSRQPNEPILQARRPSARPLMAEDALASAEAPMPEHEKSATFSELFYDLFFVANLTIFVSKNELDSVGGLGRFIAFFATLWLVYCHQTMFDVRFETWDVLNILLRLVQLGALAAFAASSRDFTSDLVSLYAGAFAVSKASLAIQYLVALCWARSRSAGNKLLVKPLFMHVCVNVYAGIIWASSTAIKGDTASTYAARYSLWGSTALIEVLTHLFVGTFFEGMTFKQTHVIERMGVLSLIILGEGVIGLGNAANLLAGGSGWSSMTILNFAAGIFIIFLVFFLYFTNARGSFSVSSLVMQLWIYMHFLFHLAVLLLASGAALVLQIQSTLVTYIATLTNPPDYPILSGARLSELYTDYSNGINSTISNLTAQQLNELNIFGDAISSSLSFHGVIVPTYEETILLENVTASLESIRPALYAQFGNLKSAAEVIQGTEIQYVAFLQHLFFVFNFILTSVGVVLIFQAVIWLLTENRHDRFSIFYAVSRIVIGLPMILINIIFINSDVGNDFLESGWPLPTAALVLLLQVIVDQIIARVAVSHYRKHDVRTEERQARKEGSPK